MRDYEKIVRNIEDIILMTEGVIANATDKYEKEGAEEVGYEHIKKALKEEKPYE